MVMQSPTIAISTPGPLPKTVELVVRKKTRTDMIEAEAPPHCLSDRSCIARDQDLAKPERAHSGYDFACISANHVGNENAAQEPSALGNGNSNSASTWGPGR